MAIQKRKRPVRRGPRRVKTDRTTLMHRAKCRELYNRLQADDDDSIQYVMDQIIGRPDVPPLLFVEDVLARFSATVETVQPIAYGAKPHYRVFLRYQDRTQQKRIGGPFATLYCAKHSTRLIHAVTLAYIEISKNIGRFV
jgi:hypothetical protein